MPGELRSKRLVRRLICLAVLAVPALGPAQGLQDARTIMDSALAELSTHRQVTLVLEGTQDDGGLQRSFTAILAIEFSIRNGRQWVTTELMDYRDGQLIGRIAGDGERFWDYDVKSKVYKSTEYGTAHYVGKERERLFQNLALRMKGDQTVMARLLKDAFGGTLNASAAWLPWRSNSQVTIEGSGIVCRSNAPSPNTTTYRVVQTPGFGWALDGIDYIEEAVVSGRRRITQWRVSIQRDLIPQGTSWFFVPPAGSRAVSVSEVGGF